MAPKKRHEAASSKRETTRRAKPTAAPLGSRRRVQAEDVPLPQADTGLDLDPSPVRNVGFEDLVHSQLALLAEDRCWWATWGPVTKRTESYAKPT